MMIENKWRIRRHYRDSTHDWSGETTFPTEEAALDIANQMNRYSWKYVINHTAEPVPQVTIPEVCIVCGKSLPTVTFDRQETQFMGHLFGHCARCWEKEWNKFSREVQTWFQKHRGYQKYFASGWVGIVQIVVSAGIMMDNCTPFVAYVILLSVAVTVAGNGVNLYKIVQDTRTRCQDYTNDQLLFGGRKK